MKRMQRALCLAPLSGVLLLCVWPAWGGGAKTDKKADEAAMAKSVADLAVAHKLIDFGRERGSAHALLLAAEILAREIVAKGAPPVEQLREVGVSLNVR